ncbi:MAG TPA: GNAT family N-acetyltransferase [Deinococcales bacterium]|nr:GNAT family N-acetyltransferase [Deinococcales bacterium]
MTGYSVRPGAPSDARLIAPILAEILGRQRLEDSIVEALNTNILRMLSTPGSTLLVAEAPDGSLLGFASVWTRWGVLDQSPSGLLDRIVVRPSHERSTVPSALLEQALGACQAMGCGSVELVLTPESTVHAEALEGFGFQRQGERFYLEII